MGIYQRLIVPRLINAAMRNKRLLPLRERQVAMARGRVLEIGIGSGLNLPLYRRNIEAVIGIDPSLELLTMARRHTAWLHFPVKLLHGPAEALPLEDGSIDSVVMTWTLCSVAEPGAGAGRGAPRAGAGRRPDLRRARPCARAGVRRWQDRLTPLWRKACRRLPPEPARSSELIEQADFRIAELETGYLVKGPRFATFHYRRPGAGLSQSPSSAPSGRAGSSCARAPPRGGRRRRPRAGRRSWPIADRLGRLAARRPGSGTPTRARRWPRPRRRRGASRSASKRLQIRSSASKISSCPIDRSAKRS